MTRDMFAEADQNVVNVAKSLSDMVEVIDALRNFGHSFFNSYDSDGDRYREALTVMRNEVYRKYCEAITKCFCLAGVGGEAANEYSREKFEERFGKDRIIIMDFLDEYGRIPSGWSTAEGEEFGRQMKEKIKKVS